MKILRQMKILNQNQNSTREYFGSKKNNILALKKIIFFY